MRNQRWGVYEEHKNIEDIMKMILKECEVNMDIKAKVLSEKFQDWWRISKNDGGVCHGKIRGQHIFKRYDGNAFRMKLITLNSK